MPPTYNQVDTVHYQNPFRCLAYYICAFGCHVYLRIFYNIKTLGRENIPKKLDDSIVVTSNHICNWDPFAIGGAIFPHKIAFMAKRELYESKKKAFWLWWVGAFAINRQKVEKASIRSAKEVLKTGHWHLGIFPEGTRKQSAIITGSDSQPPPEEEESDDIKKGAAFFARTSNAGILPIGVALGIKADGKKHYIISIGPLIPAQKGADIDTISQQIHAAMTAEKQRAQAEVDRLLKK
ncbi:MAG: 1-acyl-sn-glycerol-3-phosphate acyltransferase [Vampirovibrio sp.]|nr:1-acyl-sn-glycerol-3-phosphate acyltransferase [Vampirovibrio sp.]